MPDVRTSLTIAAPPERVWAVLTDFAAYPQWNPVISQVQLAALRAGAALRFRIKMEGAPELGFAAKIVRCEPNRELRWKGGAPLVPALAWGEHYFLLAPSGAGTELAGTEFIHGEHFGGALRLLMRGETHARVTRTYALFNQALKTRVESGT